MHRIEKEVLENGFFEGKLFEVIQRILNLALKYGEEAVIDDIGVDETVFVITVEENKNADR